MSGAGPRDRKQLIRAYKETARPMGVYRVRHPDSGTEFIGASVDLPSMLNRQRFQLEAHGHPDRALQAAWDAEGPDAFVFEVLDTLEPPDEPGHDVREELRLLETMWREKLAEAGEG